MSTTSLERPAVEAATAAARALVELVPTAAPLTPVLGGDAVSPALAAQAVLAAHVGATSADLALVLLDRASLAGAAESGPVDVTDVLRPALEAAGATTGVGVLGEVTLGDATDLVQDAASVVLALTDADGSTAGWFVLRTRRPLRTPADETVTDSRLARISNVEMRLSVIVGHTRMAVRDVLNLEPGAVVELDRSAGAPADVQLNGRTIAKGEVVVVDGGDYGVRVTKILDADD
ncbi:FliM/FliN family flagellar motor switch protein [Isoptericola sp. NPDC057391]|uniref:FliM/FliN family flagellar motor switch protein n=1 Tax=Isoptericola sp. NPDC057391 TaxID=3346117 RepID=UPI0036294A5F